MLKLSLEGQIAELEATFKAAHQVYLQDTQEPSQVPRLLFSFPSALHPPML